MEFEYDQTGDTTQLFIFGGLICYLVPATIARMGTEVVEDQDVVLRQRSDLSSLCMPKYKSLQARKKANKGWGLPFWKIVYGMAWLSLLCISYNICFMEQEAMYSPHAELGLSEDVEDTKVIKKQYRELTKIHHPDKNLDDPNAAEKFMKITKAYEALTDPVTMENIRNGRSPDGNSVHQYGIALPTWIVDPENARTILILYFIVFMVIMPTMVGSWWYSRTAYYSDEVLLNTVRVFASYVTDQQSIKNLLERLCWCEEFQSLPYQPNRDPSAVLKLHKLFSADDLPPLKKFKFPKVAWIKELACVKARILLQVHLSRQHDRLEKYPDLQKDLEIILAKVPDLVDAMIEVNKFRRPVRLSLLRNIFGLSQMIVQAQESTKESPLLQVPHFDAAVQKLCKQKKASVHDIRDLFGLDEETRDALILKDFSANEKDDVKRFGQAYPFLDVTHEVIVKGEGADDSGDITTNSTITIACKLKRLSMEGMTSLGVSQTPKAELTQAKEQVAEEDEEKASNYIPAKYLAKKGKKKGKGGKSRPKTIIAAEPAEGEDAEGKPEDNEKKDAPAADEAESTKDSTDSNTQAVDKASVAAEDSDSSDDDGADKDEADEDDEDESEDDADYVPPEFEDDGTDKAKLKEFKKNESYPVHCPYFPEVKEECWFVLLGFPQNDIAITPPQKVVTLKDEETIELQFAAPPAPGEYVFNLYVFSDSYIGMDHDIPITVKVKQGEQVEQFEDDAIEQEDSDAFTDDEDDEDDEDSDF